MRVLDELLEDGVLDAPLPTAADLNGWQIAPTHERVRRCPTDPQLFGYGVEVHEAARCGGSLSW